DRVFSNRFRPAGEGLCRLARAPRGQRQWPFRAPDRARCQTGRDRARGRSRTAVLEEYRRELVDARQQQAASSEVLQVISNSPGELEPVFNAMLENATRICGAKFGILFRYEGGMFHPAAMANVPPAFADFLDRQGSFAPVRGRLFGRLAQT